MDRNNLVFIYNMTWKIGLRNGCRDLQKAYLGSGEFIFFTAPSTGKCRRSLKFSSYLHLLSEPGVLSAEILKIFKSRKNLS